MGNQAVEHGSQGGTGLAFEHIALAAAHHRRWQHFAVQTGFRRHRLEFHCADLGQASGGEQRTH
ncbi:hypothetical protein D3C81_1903370 [compost metagenome]